MASPNRTRVFSSMAICVSSRVCNSFKVGAFPTPRPPPLPPTPPPTEPLRTEGSSFAEEGEPEEEEEEEEEEEASKAMPTWLALRAPTSLVPSPHMSV